MNIRSLSPFVLALAAAVGCAAVPEGDAEAGQPVVAASARTTEDRPANMYELLLWYERTAGGNYTFEKSTEDLLRSIEMTPIGEGDIEVTKIWVPAK